MKKVSLVMAKLQRLGVFTWCIVFVFREPVDRSILTVGDMELVASDPVLAVLSVTNQ
jgi:hypothetical protein